MSATEQDPVVGWREIAKLWRVSIRTAQRYVEQGAPVRKNSRTGRVFGRRDPLELWKKTLDEGEPVGCWKLGGPKGLSRRVA